MSRGFVAEQDQSDCLFVANWRVKTHRNETHSIQQALKQFGCSCGSVPKRNWGQGVSDGRTTRWCFGVKPCSFFVNYCDRSPPSIENSIYLFNFYTFNMVRQCVVEVCFQVWPNRVTCIQTLSTYISKVVFRYGPIGLLVFNLRFIGYISTSYVAGSIGLFSGMAQQGYL